MQHIERKRQKRFNRQIPKKIFHIPMLNPKIQSGASLGYSTIDELSFVTGMMVNERW